MAAASVEFSRQLNDIAADTSLDFVNLKRRLGGWQFNSIGTPPRFMTNSDYQSWFVEYYYAALHPLLNCL